MAHRARRIKRTETRTREEIASHRAVAGIERAEYFEQEGATATGWLGGRHMVQTDRRKESKRTACRRQPEE
jgi:hypothetical protein